MSDDSFNPYHQWLGLDPSVKRPNHYQLLGLNPAEQSGSRIADAASRAMAKVRSCRPGDRGTQWAQLLEQVTAAATCLSDPGRRAEYDRQLGGGTAAAKGYHRPAPRRRVVPAASGASAALPMQAPQGNPAASLQGTPSLGGSLDPMSPVVPAGPAGAAPAYGQRYGCGTSQAYPVPATPVYPKSSGHPVGGASGPVATSADGHAYPPAAQGCIPAGRPAAAIPVAPAPQPGRDRSVTVKVRSRARNSNLIVLAACLGVGMLLLAGVCVAIILKQKADGRSRRGAGPIVWSRPIASAPRPKSQSFQPPPPWAGPDLPPLPAGPMPANTETLTEPSFGQLDGNLPPASLPGGMPDTRPVSESTLNLPSFPGAPTLGPLDKTVPPPPSPEAQPAQPDANPEPSPPAVPMQTEPAPTEPAPTEPAPTELAPMEPAPAKPASGATDVSPEDAAALAKTLQAAHAAILAGKYDAAMAELDKVQLLPKLPGQHAKYERLTLLAGYAREFQSALESAVAALQPGDEIEVGGSAVVGFVSAAEDSITLRVTGVNRTYALDRLPVGLAVALADRWLKKDDPVSLAVKGAFVASVKGIDDERKAKARQWLEEASKKGVEGELHKVLDDTYELEKNLE